MWQGLAQAFEKPGSSQKEEAWLHRRHAHIHHDLEIAWPAVYDSACSKEEQQHPLQLRWLPFPAAPNSSGRSDLSRRHREFQSKTEKKEQDSVRAIDADG
ncbi:hypothetical protein BHE74_00041341 [Ensete ventricosum]|nr:hypothetical protein BHE74_00041341 [Ensete ventricosum]